MTTLLISNPQFNPGNLEREHSVEVRTTTYIKCS
jgi:hypothetical protein